MEPEIDMEASEPAEPSESQTRKYLVRVHTAAAEYEGLFYSPFPKRRLSDVLTRMEQFINLKDARDVATGDTFSFMVISKSAIETIKVIKEWA